MAVARKASRASNPSCAISAKLKAARATPAVVAENGTSSISGMPAAITMQKIATMYLLKNFNEEHESRVHPAIDTADRAPQARDRLAEFGPRNRAASSQCGNQKYSRRSVIWTAISSINAAMIVAIPGIPLSGENRTRPTMSNKGPNDLLPIAFTTAPSETSSPSVGRPVEAIEHLFKIRDFSCHRLAISERCFGRCVHADAGAK